MLRLYFFIVHVILGYTAAFVLVPMLLIKRKDILIHRKLGEYYTDILLILFVTGMFFLYWNTFRINYHAIMTFNFCVVGIYFVLIGRSLVGEKTFAKFLRRIKPILNMIALTSSLILFFMGWFPEEIYLFKFDFSTIIFGFFGIIFSGIQFKKIRGFVFKGPGPTIINEHIFYMILSYLFLLTSLAITALKGYVGHEIKYLGVSALGFPALILFFRKNRKMEKEAIYLILGLALLIWGWVIFTLVT